MHQFFHQRIIIPNQTYSILVDKDINATKVNQYVVLEMGIANCHPEDNYEKKVGRDIAVSRAEPHLFKVFLKDLEFTRMVCQTTDIVLTFKGNHLHGICPGNYHI